MKKIISLFIVLNLILSCMPVKKVFASNDEKVEVVRGNYTLYSEYIREENIVVIEAYENGEHFKTLRLPVYNNELNDDLARISIPVPTETETGFGYYPETTYWIYACSQDLVDSGQVSYRGINVGLNSIPQIQQEFRNKVDYAIGLESSIQNANFGMFRALLGGIISGLASFINMTFFAATVIAYVEALSYQIEKDSLEEKYINTNGLLAQYYLKLHQKRI